ncbi:hypothetical protein HLH12_11020 [Acinetobacter sp. NIPH 2377]|uniref:hypothetical protein n=1 Tax=Acinetobacter terrestris TaxID=2529843 RepID=UPI0014901378|nr:hypothetical protein [Acinetobacter terrestris]NNH36070.1 hypothetical protein [Acinetobacter terrestris]
MDALKLLIKHRNSETFISIDNHISLLVWFTSNEDRNEKKLSGVTFTYASEANISENEKSIISKIKYFFNSKNILILDIIFNNNCDSFIINREKFNESEAINYINKFFQLPPKNDDNQNAKPINKKTQVQDKFHIWSRNKFHPNRVIKQDIDVLSFRKNNFTIYEVKRSNRPPNWKPYKDDINNYESLFIFQNYLGCKFITLNHPAVQEANDDFKEILHNQAIRAFKNEIANLSFDNFVATPPVIYTYNKDSDTLKKKEDESV